MIRQILHEIGKVIHVKELPVPGSAMLCASVAGDENGAGFRPAPLPKPAKLGAHART